MEELDKIKEDIKQLESVLCDKKKELFSKRLKYLCRDTNIINNVSNISSNSNINEDLHLTDYSVSWHITYNHMTSKYTHKDYLYEIVEFDPRYTDKTSLITIGKLRNSTKYFINGGVKFIIYRDHYENIRIINPEYEFDLDMDQQDELIDTYIKNINIPESFGLKLLKYFGDFKWSDKKIAKYISIT